jgi:hypothetical protein
MSTQPDMSKMSNDELLEYVDSLVPSHVNYPHTPGFLYDCPACESQCYCDLDVDVSCVYCAILLGTESPDVNVTTYDAWEG